jgi:hypothetical protein
MDNAERIRLTKMFLEQLNTNTLRQPPDPATWIALKFSCSLKTAQKLIAKAKESA